MRYKSRSYGSLHASILFVLLFSQGCVANLPAVREFSVTTITASSTFDVIADDLPKSCKRRVEISFIPSPSDKLTIEDNRVEYSTEYLDALSKCDDLETSLNGIIEVNNVLKEYAEAIGELASDDVVTFTQELDALESSMKQISINGNNPFDGPRAVAVSSLAKFLFNAAINGYRQKKLKETIQMGNEPLIEITVGLSDVASDYQVILRNEIQNVKALQANLILQRKKPENEREFFKLSDAEIDEQLFVSKQMIEFIEIRVNAAEDYENILRKIAEIHEQLYLNTNNLNSARLISEIQAYASELIPLINNIREAYSH
ncbi:MAG: hypothetical protein ACRENZ_08285 [Thermodesulfobacteriota bacterium]